MASWPKNIIRASRVAFGFHKDPEMSYVFEQAGVMVQFYENGMRRFQRDERETLLLDEKPELRAEWDDELGDRQLS